MSFEENGVYYIRGMVSVGPSSTNKNTQERVCDSTQYVLFTDIAQYLSWIEEVVYECEKTVQCHYSK